MKAAAIAALLAVAAVAIVSASPQFGSCEIVALVPMDGGAPGFKQVVIDNSTKSCSRCVWQYFTQAAGTPWVTDLFFDGELIPTQQLVTADCGDGYFTNATLSPGICLLWTSENLLIDTQEQNCIACAQQCDNWAACDSMIWNYRYTQKPANLTGACPAL